MPTSKPNVSERAGRIEHARTSIARVSTLDRSVSRPTAAPSLRPMSLRRRTLRNTRRVQLLNPLLTLRPTLRLILRIVPSRYKVRTIESLVPHIPGTVPVIAAPVSRSLTLEVPLVLVPPPALLQPSMVPLHILPHMVKVLPVRRAVQHVPPIRAIALRCDEWVRLIVSLILIVVTPRSP